MNALSATARRALLRALPVAVAAVLAALLGGCGGGAPDAADGAEVMAAAAPEATVKAGARALAAPALAGLDAAPALAVRSADVLVRAPGTVLAPTLADAAAAARAADGVPALVARLTAAMASRAACASATSGMRPALAAQARYDTLAAPLTGRAAVADAWCSYLDEEGLWGAQVAAPTPTRCTQQGGQPLCRINLDLLAADGSVRRLGSHLAVTREAGQWQLLGHVDALPVTAFAAAQRERRVDGGTPVDRYRRALVIAIDAQPGLGCARVSQSGAQGGRTTLAYFKPYDGLGVRRLSLWRTGSGDLPRSMDPAAGDLRVVDDTTLDLPEGSAGDAIVKALERDGGSVHLTLYADAQCSRPLALADGSTEFDVDVDGVPPLSTVQALLPWPTLGTAAAIDLRRLALNVRGSASFVGAWTGLASGFRPDLAMLCVDSAHCAEGDDGRVGERALARDAIATTLTLKNGRQAVLPADFKLLSVSGRSTSGVAMLADFHSCGSQAAGRACP